MNAQVADEKKRIIWAVNPFDEERYRCTWAHCVAEAARLMGVDRAKRMVSFSLFLLVLFFNGCAREHGTHPTGEILYRHYCASCHGLGGKGDGPLATSLRRPPTDLTTLRRRGGGRFDEAAVMAVIDGRRVVTEHGPREMPVWGVVFEEELKDQPYTGYTGALRSRVLADYLRSIQQE